MCCYTNQEENKTVQGSGTILKLSFLRLSPQLYISANAKTGTMFITCTHKYIVYIQMTMIYKDSDAMSTKN